MSDQIPDKLIEIPCSEWTNLRDMYLHDFPTHMVGYNTMNNYIQWNQIKSDIKHLHIYSLNGDWKRDGTFLVVDRYYVYPNSINNNSIERILRALMLLDWKHGLIFGALLERHRQAVLQTMSVKQITTMLELRCAVYHMTRSEAASLDVVCPDGISLRPLSTQEHAIIVNDAWHLNRQGSLFYLKRLIDWNLNVGAFTDDGKLVAWCLLSPIGTLRALQVDPTYMKRGLGTLVVKAISKRLSDVNMDTYAFVSSGNVISNSLFAKIGFKIVDYCSVLETNPLAERDWNVLDSN